MNRLKNNPFTLGRIMRITGTIVLLVLILFYVQFQSRNFINGPSITLSDDYEVVQHSQSFVLRGTTENIVKLTLNGLDITTDEQGNFEHPVHLERGYNIVTLYAEDRFGRSTEIQRDYVFIESE